MIKTRHVGSSPTITTSSQRILKRNPSRVAVIFSNLGANTVSIDNIDTVSVSLGLQLDGNGGLLNFKKKDDGVLPQDEWFGIAGASQQIKVIEIIATEPMKGGSE